MPYQLKDSLFSSHILLQKGWEQSRLNIGSGQPGHTDFGMDLP